MWEDEREYSDRDLARISEWNRLVMENADLMAEVRYLRHRLIEFPLGSSQEYVDWVAWHEKTDSEQLELYYSEKKRLLKKYGLRKWGLEFHIFLVFGEVDIPSWTPEIVPILIGTPKINDKRIYEVKIDPKVDVSNPRIQRYIDALHRIEVERTDPPPAPMTGGFSDPRKKDWRPLWEWCQRYPYFTRADIARMLGLNRTYVSRKLSEIEKQMW